MNLREMAAELKDLMDSLTDGEIKDDEVEQRIGQLGEAFEAKHDAIRVVMQELQARGNARADEWKRIRDLADIDQRAFDRLKAWLMIGMKTAGLKRIETDLFRTRIQANSQPSVKVECRVAELPEKFVRVAHEPSNPAILEAFKAGESLPAGVTVTRGEHLRLG